MLVIQPHQQSRKIEDFYKYNKKMYRGNLHAKQKQEKQLNSSPENKISNGELFKTSLVYQTKEFFTNSTLHGVRYIAEQGRPTGEK